MNQNFMLLIILMLIMPELLYAQIQGNTSIQTTTKSNGVVSSSSKTSTTSTTTNKTNRISSKTSSTTGKKVKPKKSLYVDYGKQIDLGGGYSIPNLPSSNEYTAGAAGFDTTFNSGLDCGRIDWQAQFQQELKLDLNGQDLQDLGNAAIAGTAKYITANMMPTWYETLQTAVRNAKAMLKIAKADCNSVASTLEKYNPIDKARAAFDGKKMEENANSGATIDKAREDASKLSFDWSSSEQIDKMSVSKDTKGLLKGFLGNVSLHAGNNNGAKTAKGDALNVKKVDDVFASLNAVIFKKVYERITTGKDCSQPFTLSSKEASDILAKVKKDVGANSNNTEAAPVPVEKNVAVADGAVIDATTSAKGAKEGSTTVVQKGGVSAANITSPVQDAATLEAQQKAKQENARLEAAIQNIYTYAVASLNGVERLSLSCSAIETYRNKGVTSDGYTIIASVIAKTLAIQGLENSLTQMNAVVNDMPLTTTDGNAKFAQEIYRKRIAALEKRLKTLKDTIKREKQDAQRVLAQNSKYEMQVAAMVERDAQAARLRRGTATAAGQSTHLFGQARGY